MSLSIFGVNFSLWRCQLFVPICGHVICKLFVCFLCLCHFDRSSCVTRGSALYTLGDRFYFSDSSAFREISVRHQCDVLISSGNFAEIPASAGKLASAARLEPTSSPSSLSSFPLSQHCSAMSFLSYFPLCFVRVFWLFLEILPVFCCFRCGIDLSFWYAGKGILLPQMNGLTRVISNIQKI